MTLRPDDPIGMQRFKDAYFGSRALVVLGGPSGACWRELREELRPDVVLGANGTCLEIPDLDFWMIAENMTRAAGLASKDARQAGFMRMFTASHHAKTRLISHRSWSLLTGDLSNCVRIRRMGIDLQPPDFSLREYGAGFLHGPMFQHPGALRPSVKFRVGTVAVHLLHLAGILGCSEVHSIGMDFCFREGSHHWYQHPKYQPDRFRTETMFTTYAGLRTQWDWIEGAQWLGSLESLFRRDGLLWRDHSRGLLEALGVFSTSTTSTPDLQSAKGTPGWA